LFYEDNVSNCTLDSRLIDFANRRPWLQEKLGIAGADLKRQAFFQKGEGVRACQ
jgi:hypothetical protein